MNMAWKNLMGLHGCGHTSREEIVLRNALSIALGARAVCQYCPTRQLEVGLAQKLSSGTVSVESMITGRQKSDCNTHKHNKPAPRAMKI